MMNLRINEGGLGDLEQITQINNFVFNGTKSPAQIRTRLSLYQNSHITLAKTEDKMIGYGMGYEKRGKYYMWMFGVIPGYRKKGIGSGILEEQIRFAKEQGYSKFLVKTSNKWRDMLRICIKRGFDITGFKINEWGSDSAVWMELDLNKESREINNQF